MSFKDRVPALIRRSVGRVRAYIRRLAYWADVARLLRGESAVDRAVLRRAILNAPMDSLRGLDKWRDPMVADDCTVLARGIGTFGVRAGSDDLYHILPSREPAIVATMERLLRPGGCFVDAGANIGVYSVLGARLVAQGGQVIAVEMMPDTAALLRRHLAINHCAGVAVVEAALSDEAGRKVEATVTPGKYGQASIAIEQAGASIAVETTTFAAILSGVDEVDLLKVDLEGAELAAMHGFGPSIAKVRAVIFEDLAKAGVREWFAAAGFEIRPLDGANWLAVRP